MAATNHSTQRTVDSMETLATAPVTIRLTAIGGVNCPMARFIVIITPNYTGSHWNARISGTSSGSMIR